MDLRKSPRHLRARVRVGALVDLWTTSHLGDVSQTLFVSPTPEAAPEPCTVVAPSSPEGEALLGRTVGETIELPWCGKRQVWTVLEVTAV